MTGRIVMSKKIVNSERTVAGKTKKIVVQTIKTIVAQMDPELPIAPGTIIHETTPQALTCHEAANAASYPRAFRVLRATKMAMTRVGELGRQITQILILVSAAKIAARTIIEPATVAGRRAVATQMMREILTAPARSGQASAPTLLHTQSRIRRRQIAITAQPCARCRVLRNPIPAKTGECQLSRPSVQSRARATLSATTMSAMATTNAIVR